VFLALAVAGIVSLHNRPIARAALTVWLIAAAAGVVLGGSYWSHYLIALVPLAAAGSGVALSRRRLIGPIAAAALCVPVLVAAIVSDRDGSTDGWDRATLASADYIKDRALPGQTFYALYAHVNAVYYTGLRDPFPYNWSLMMRSAPHAVGQLRALLASPGRPTWILEAQSPSSWGLDRGGATRRLLTRHYRVAGHVCSRTVLLARGAPARPIPPGGSACVSPNGTEESPELG
jgi:hypothetical protein